MTVYCGLPVRVDREPPRQNGRSILSGSISPAVGYDKVQVEGVETAAHLLLRIEAMQHDDRGPARDRQREKGMAAKPVGGMWHT